TKGLSVDERKVEAVHAYGELRNTTHIRQFMGLAGYYSRFIQGYQQLARPLVELTKKNAKFVWGKAQEKAMQWIKDALTTAPVLAYPNMKTPFSLTTDASDIGLGAILSQFDIEEEDVEYVVQYASKALSPAERNYNTTHREGLAVIWGTKKFERYLRGREFIIYTDHSALTSILTVKEPRGRVGRWAMLLQEYNFKTKRRSAMDPIQLEALKNSNASEYRFLRDGTVLKRLNDKWKR
ncbi:7232_t:CDS:2, partial [Paraglomus occultum]